MKVVVPYCKLNPRVVNAINRDGISATFVDTYSTINDYWNLLHGLWVEKETFILVEQDKVFDEGAVQELWECPSDWCVYPVKMDNGDYAQFPTLSVVKFSERLISDEPDMVNEIGSWDMGFGKRHWDRLDLAVASYLQERYTPCWHDKDRVEHDHGGN